MSGFSPGPPPDHDRDGSIDALAHDPVAGPVVARLDRFRSDTTVEVPGDLAGRVRQRIASEPTASGAGWLPRWSAARGPVPGAMGGRVSTFVLVAAVVLAFAVVGLAGALLLRPSDGGTVPAGSAPVLVTSPTPGSASTPAASPTPLVSPTRLVSPTPLVSPTAVPVSRSGKPDTTARPSATRSVPNAHRATRADAARGATWGGPTKHTGSTAQRGDSSAEPSIAEMTPGPSPGTPEPTPEATAEPTAEPTPEPTAEPSRRPRHKHPPRPTAEPSPEPILDRIRDAAPSPASDGPSSSPEA